MNAELVGRNIVITRGLERVVFEPWAAHQFALTILKLVAETETPPARPAPVEEAPES